MNIKQNLLQLKRSMMICSITVSYLNGKTKVANISFEELGQLFLMGILREPENYTYFCNIHGKYNTVEEIKNIIIQTEEIREAYLKLAMLEYGDLHPN